MRGRVRLVSGGIRALEFLSGAKTLDAETLVEAAVRSTGHSGIAVDDVLEPLDRYLRACRKEALLSPLGRWTTWWDSHRLLSILLRLRAEDRQAPEILAEAVPAPVFITGIPRSGTTFLHRLMAEDPAAMVPRCWQTIYPYPAAGCRPGGSDSRPRLVEMQLRSFAFLSPEIQSIHPIRSQSPQECTEITAHVFQSLRFEATYQIPSYHRWLRDHGHAAAYRFHKTFLQHLQRQHRRRHWVLKSPDHVFALEALLDVYPDARFVFVHRDPLKVIPSVARLTEVLRSPFAERVDRAGIGRQVVEDWVSGSVNMVEADRRGLVPPDRIFHLHYSDLVARPLDAIAGIYDRFGLALSPEAAERMARLVGSQPRGGYGRNHYRLDDYAITAGEVRERFQDYVRHFNIPLEVEAAGRSAP